MSASNPPRSSEPSGKVKPTSAPASLAPATEKKKEEEVKKASDKKQVEAPVEAKQAEEPSKTVVSGVGLQLAYGDSDEESGGEEENVEEETKENEAASLPVGFFDDASQDAIAHNKPPPKPVNLDEEFAAFQDEIEGDLEALDQAEDEQVKQLVEERDKEDKEEQEEMATRIDELKKARELLKQRRTIESQGDVSKRMKLDSTLQSLEDEDEEDEEDDLLDWRKKGMTNKTLW
mmetsp:Transcript_44363/g.139984  ORF Transcript_44363/g.139984 Transcript_44363/m.139984 type:complete len:233 (-) Transcript_44363:170-868(-)